MNITNEVVALFNPSVELLTKLAKYCAITVKGPDAYLDWAEFYPIEELDNELFWEVSDNF